MSSITRRENILKAYRHETPHFIPSYSDCDFCIPSALEEGPTQIGASKDGWGVTWLLFRGQPGPIQDEKVPVVLDDVTKWKEIVQFPDVETYDWETCAAKDTAAWDRENKISNVVLVNGLWERFFALHGFENSLCDILVEPEATCELLHAIAEHKVTYMKKIAKYYKADKIQLHDDYGTERSLFMSIDTWREIIKPNLKIIVDACHELGMIYEHHSCGYIKPLIDDFVELGIDAWNPVQYTNGPNELIPAYKGKLTFVGGFNDRIFVNPEATDADKKASIGETVNTLGETGNWVPLLSVGDDYMQFASDTIHNYNVPKYKSLGLDGPLFERPSNVEKRKFSLVDED